MHENVPALYQSILVLVDELERSDRRTEAGRIRQQALAAYATSWDDEHRRRLERLEERLHRALALRRAPGRRWLRLP